MCLEIKGPDYKEWVLWLGKLLTHTIASYTSIKSKFTSLSPSTKARHWNKGACSHSAWETKARRISCVGKQDSLQNSKFTERPFHKKAV